MRWVFLAAGLTMAAVPAMAQSPSMTPQQNGEEFKLCAQQLMRCHQEADGNERSMVTQLGDLNKHATDLESRLKWTLDNWVAKPVAKVETPTK